MPIPQTGPRLDALKALRKKLATQIDECESGRDLAALAGRLQSVLAEIDEVAKATSAGPASPADDLAAKRAARRRA